MERMIHAAAVHELPDLDGAGLAVDVDSLRIKAAAVDEEATHHSLAERQLARRGYGSLVEALDRCAGHGHRYAFGDLRRVVAQIEERKLAVAATGLPTFTRR